MLRQRHGISELPDMGGDKPAKQNFKVHPTGYVQIDIAEVRTRRQVQLNLGIDRTPKFTSR